MPKKAAQKKAATTKAPEKIKELPPHKRGIKLRKLKLENFKAFDKFEIEFPEPDLPDDPDIMVIGSENGVGKTTILEAIALVFLFTEVLNNQKLPKQKLLLPKQDFGKLFVRSGSQTTKIYANFSPDANANQYFDYELTLGTEGLSGSIGDIHFLNNSCLKNYISNLSGLNNIDVEQLFNILLGRSHFPFILPGIAYFHSYRKIKEGSITPNDLFKKNSNLFVNFKEKIVKSFFPKMGSDNEPKEQKEQKEQKELFNSLLDEFAGVYYKTPFETPDGLIDIPVFPVDSREPFNFDGLSSGQKEIVSMIYLIWEYARKNSIILIDEPELHLNAGWHSLFIHRLCKLMPENQYIIATHSEDVFGSVDRDRRVLLIPDKKQK